ncbi:MAG: ATP-binding protein [Candidatus Hermodarchaeota archaeon]
MSLESRLNFEKVISSISSRFVGNINLDDAINSSFQDLGLLSKSNRVSLFLFNGNKRTIENTHEWCADGISSQLKKLQKIEIEKLSWWKEQVEKISFINIRDISSLPDNAITVKEFLLKQDIKSLLAFPIYVKRDIAGYVCFIKTLEKTQWKGKDFAILRIFSQILGDTIERLNAETELRESKELLRATFEATADGILAINDDDVITNMNARFIYMWRIPEDIAEQTDFKKLLEYIVDQLKESSKFLLKMYNLRKTSEDAYDMIFFKDGRIFEQYSCPLFHDGQNVGRVWSFKDITEHQHAEQELRKSEKKYRDAYERAEFYKDIMSHDINNIFHNIQSSIELINILKEQSTGMEEIEEIFQIVDNQIIRGVKLIDNVYKLSKLQETEMTLKKVNLYKYLDEAIIFANKSSQGKKLDIRLNKNKEEIIVLANEFLLDVFENILHNAIKYNQNLTIEIQINILKQVINLRKYIKLEFKDNGIGIFDENKESIFQKGFKRDRKVRGMGIGLSLVKKIIESYDGRIWVENRIKDDYEQGSNFILLIPELE